MATTVDALLSNNQKRLATLSKSLEKKRRALKVQEEMASETTLEDIESNKTYLYYVSEITRIEDAFEMKKQELDELEKRDKEIMERKKQEMIQKLEQEHATRKLRYTKEVMNAYNESERKTKYYQDAIATLKEKLSSSKPTSKVYRRLKAEIDLEQQEYDKLCKDMEAATKHYNEVVLVEMAEEAKNAARREQAAKEREAEEARQRALEQVLIAREAQKRSDEERWAQQAEEAKKTLGDTNSIVSEEKPASEKISNPPPPVEKKKHTPSPKNGDYLKRIQDAKTVKDLEAIYNEKKGKFTDEEDALWDARFEALEAEENKVEEESVASEASEKPTEVIPDYSTYTLEELHAIDYKTVPDSHMRPICLAINAKEAEKRAAPKATPLPPPKPVGENSIVSGPPILTTTKMKAKTVGGGLGALRPLGAYHG